MDVYNTGLLTSKSTFSPSGIFGALWKDTWIQCVNHQSSNIKIKSGCFMSKCVRWLIVFSKKSVEIGLREKMMTYLNLGFSSVR